MHSIARPTTAAAVALALAFAGALVIAAPASAATFPVTTNADSGAGSLRQAILDANAAGGADIITFQAGLSPIVLTSGTIPITDALTINGAGSPSISLGAATPFMFSANLAGDLTLTNLTLSGGAGLGGGLAISAVGGLTVTNSSFTGFSTTDEGGAIGALTVTGGVTITDSTFTSNAAVDPGGAIYLGDVIGATTITRSTFSSNASDSVGGAVFGNDLNTLTITSSTFSENVATVSGGAIGVNGVAGNSRIELSTFDDNAAGVGGPVETQGGAIYLGAVAADRTFTIISSTISNNTLTTGTLDPRGAGLFAGDIDGTLVIDSSTFTANMLSGVGGGISVGVCAVNPDGLLQIINSTFDETVSTTEHVIDVCTNDGEIEVLFSTLVGPGILRIGTNGGDALVSSSIVDGDNTAVSALAIDGAPVLVEWSTVSIASGVFGVDAGDGVQFNVTDPKLGPLQNNGGPTFTRLLLSSSPALDMGNPAVSGQPSFDQRGSGFPRVIGGRIDIGAIEMPRTLPATGAELPVPLLIGGILLIIVGAALIIVRIRRRA
jgi:LPXTG-motif cell wall-anchored protein